MSWGQVQRLIERQGRRARDVLAEALAGQELLDEVGVALVFTEVVDRDEVVLGEPRGAFGLLSEACTRRIVVGEVAMKELDRDGAPLGAVSRPEDRRNTPGADLFC